MKNKDILDYWPFPYEPRQNQITALQWLQDQDAKYLLLEAPVGCHLKETPILMFDGSLINVENIKIGDLLMGPDSKPRKVLSLKRGREQMYTITPTKGESFVVNGNHVLSLKTTKARRSGFDGNTVINITVNEYLKKSQDFKNNTKLYRAENIEFQNNTKLPIEPYFLGLLIGDGTICNGHVGLTTADTEIYEEVLKQAQNYNLTINSHGIKTPTHYLTTGKRGGDISIREKNMLYENLKEIQIYGTKSNNKFIPHIYKTASIKSRLEMLAGLIDSDGYYKGIYEFSTKSFELAKDVDFISKSLGFAANIKTRHIKQQIYYSVFISGDLDRIPTKLKRKQASSRKQKKRVNVTSFKVTPHSINNYYGFEVDKDNLYLMGDFIVTHNSGKSNIGVTYSHFLGQRSRNYRGDSFILTPQRILQEQYEQSFKGNDKINLASFYGKSNYQCRSKNTSCEVGSIVKPTCDHCPFQKAKYKAQSAADTVLNYKLALTSFAFAPTFNKRKLLIFDECHNIENHLIDFDALQIADWRCKKYNLKFKTFKEINKAIEWLSEYYIPELQKILKKLEDECEPLFDKSGTDLTRSEINKLREFNALYNHYDEAVSMSLRTPEYINKKFVLVWDNVMFQFKRLKGAYSFHKHVVPFADKFLFMSSTILNKEGFCDDLGIPEEETAFLSVDSDFPKENRQVIYMPQMKMNAKWKDKEQESDRKRMIDTIIQLLEMHKDDTGIIHTGNFQIAEWLVNNLENKISHRIYHHNPNVGDDRNSVITAFTGDPKPSVLISPSSTEGLDLKDDLGRFAIFVKVPFGYLGDQWIKKRMEMSNQWYQRRALIDIIQGGGRVVRSNIDWGNTYILDQSWQFLYKQAYHMIPRWWRDAYSKI